MRPSRMACSRLSLVPHLVSQIYSVEGARMAVNYGSNRVRFVTPVRVGSRIRASSVLQGAEPVADAVHLTVATTIEIEGAAATSRCRRASGPLLLLTAGRPDEDES